MTRSSHMTDFTIEYVENRLDLVPVVASWVWSEWGYGSADACASELRQSRRGSVPTRLVAIADGEPSGVVNLIRCNLPPRCDLTPWLAGLYVHPSRRGEGIGAALVRSCESEAASLGFGRLFLYTEQAEAFYQRLGWETMDSAVWEGQEVAIMVRDLPSELTDDSPAPR
jgi:predicted N-acetyltransferase YhbS